MMTKKMFDWLKLEIAQIKTPKFHVVDGPADVKLEGAVTRSNLPVPQSYSEFVLEFGNAKLYRQSWDGYTICVFGGPREAALKDGTKVYYLGFNDTARVYVKASNDKSSNPVFEFDDGEERMAGDFAEWLFESCKFARRHYRKEWDEIVCGPKPFTAEELKMLATRQKIKWQVKGIDDQRNLIFEVKNRGSCALSFLTVGLRSHDRTLNGAVRLDTGGIAPGQTGILHVDCYRKFRPPQEMEAFPLPEPGPEDRKYYYEFQQRR